MSSTEIIYGTNPVLELLKAGRRRCHEIFIVSGRKETDVKKIEDEAKQKRIPVKFVTREELAKISATEKNQGIAARCDFYPYSSLEDILAVALKSEEKGFIVILDGITDPQNLGSLVRTSNIMGAHGVIIPKDNAAAVGPTVVKASAGATEHQRIAQITNISTTIAYIKEEGFWVTGAEGESQSSLYLNDFIGQNIAIVLGSEGKGIRRLVREKCDFLLSIPMLGQIESYNVSVAGALFMGEVARQRWLFSHSKTAKKTV